jgi:hypothetical protein
MPIARGEAWGSPGPLPDDGVVVRSDAGARAVVEAARRAGRPVPPLGLLGGDLCRTLGGRGDEDRLRSPAAVRLPVDLGAVLLDGRLHWFVAHLVARRRLWRGRALLAMNAEWLGRWDVAPRAHPGDGLLDVYETRLGLADLAAVRRRLPHGAHLPHPGIRERRVRALQLTLDPPLPVALDGVVLGPATSLSIRVEPDAVTVVV